LRAALQRFVAQCVFSATFLSLSVIETRLSFPLQTVARTFVIFFL